MTATVTEEKIVTSTDKPESAHYVVAPDDTETNHAYVMRARVEGFPITALCGYTWIPWQKAEGLPVCEECREIYENCPDDGGEEPKE